MPSARFTHATSTTAAPDVTWAALQLPETWATLAGVVDVSDERFLDDGVLAGFSFVVAVGGQRYVGTATTVRHQIGDGMSIHIESSELEGTVTVDLADGDGTTDIEATLELAPRSFLATMFFPAISAAVGKGFPAHAEALVSRLDAA